MLSSRLPRRCRSGVMQAKVIGSDGLASIGGRSSWRGKDHSDVVSWCQTRRLWPGLRRHLKALRRGEQLEATGAPVHLAPAVRLEADNGEAGGGEFPGQALEVF